MYLIPKKEINNKSTLSLCDKYKKFKIYKIILTYINRSKIDYKGRFFFCKKINCSLDFTKIIC
jgi:hypothetical protein